LGQKEPGHPIFFVGKAINFAPVILPPT